MDPLRWRLGHVVAGPFGIVVVLRDGSLLGAQFVLLIIGLPVYFVVKAVRKQRAKANGEEDKKPAAKK